jgi:hypothetical protein
MSVFTKSKKDVVMVKEKPTQSLAIKKKANELVAKVQSLDIIDQDSYAIAVSYKAMAKQLGIDIDAYWEPIVDPAYKTWKAATSKRGEMQKVQVQINKIVGEKINVYLGDMERERIKAQEEADKKALKVADKKIDLLLNKAEVAEAKGDFGQADLLRSKADNVFVEDVVIETQLPLTVELAGGLKGSMGGVDYEVTIENLQQLIDALAIHKLPLNVVKIEVSKKDAKAWAKSGMLPEGIHFGLKVEKKFGVRLTAETKGKE